MYALNDVVDYRSDKEKIRHGPTPSTNDLDAVFVRHLMAQGLQLREGILWTVDGGDCPAGATLEPGLHPVFTQGAWLKRVMPSASEYDPDGSQRW